MFEALANINWEVIFQLLFVGLIVISGPVVIFVLAFRNGNL
ncbi:MAG: photosystem II reaction center protein Ycf12 [Goleter apudmare HA4340-LM2]|nr:photosystem II reaction center protein Ycf12 [Goleter apudmare HA4340-LM2]